MVPDGATGAQDSSDATARLDGMSASFLCAVAPLWPCAPVAPLEALRAVRLYAPLGIARR